MAVDQGETIQNKDILPSLPFTYLKTEDVSKATFTKPRIPPLIKVEDKTESSLIAKTDQEILSEIKKENESKNWFTQEYWRKKGMPLEQIEFKIGGQEITLYNYDEEAFTDNHLKQTEETMKKFFTKFPQAFGKIRWIIIDDKQSPSYFGDEEKYPYNGETEKSLKLLRLYPRALKSIQHRIPSVSNLKGTLTHELAHLVNDQIASEWNKHFLWKSCRDFPNDWQERPTSDWTGKKFFNRYTGEMSPWGEIPMQPEQCVTEYAKGNVREDIADSVVAFLHDPQLLKMTSPEKFNILEKKSSNKPKEEVSAQRISEEKISLPEIKPTTFYYFIEEPKV